MSNFILRILNLLTMSIGRILIISGIIILILGLGITLLGPKLRWFGNLPFDFKIKNESVNFFAPFGSMILVSIVITIISNILYKIFK